MESVEFGAEGVFGWSGIDGNHLGAKLSHARGDVVLRDDRKEQHRDYGERGRLDQRFRREFEGEACDEIEHAGDYSEVVETPRAMPTMAPAWSRLWSVAKSAGATAKLK